MFSSEFLAWCSVIGTTITLLGFVFTLWQVIALKRQVRKRIFEILSMISVVDLIRQIELLQRDLDASQWNCAYLRIQELNKGLLEISKETGIKQCVRDDFDKVMGRMPSDIDLIHRLSTGDETNNDIRFLQNNLQALLDNLTFIKIYYKKK